VTDPGSRPANLDEYEDWMWDGFNVRSAQAEDQYRRVVASILRQFESGRYWKNVLTMLPELESEYYVDTGFLLTSSVVPDMIDKPWASFWQKTFRRNVTENNRWPRPPVGGWLTPEHWLIQIGDAVRTRIVVRYLDGVEGVVDLLQSAAKGTRWRPTSTLQATREGYYAAHVSIVGRYEVPKATFDTDSVRARVEVQVTTQVKDVIQELLHKYYDERRRSTDPAPDAPEWDYLSDAFRTTYLGHLAHHMEGLIMDLRQEGPK